MQERISEYPLLQDVPLLLRQNERCLRDEIAQLEARIADIQKTQTAEIKRQSEDYRDQGDKHLRACL